MISLPENEESTYQAAYRHRQCGKQPDHKGGNNIRPKKLSERTNFMLSCVQNGGVACAIIIEMIDNLRRRCWYAWCCVHIVKDSGFTDC